MLYVGIMNVLFLVRYGSVGKVSLRDQLYFVVLFGLFLFSAFRYEVGCDWGGYYWQYVSAGYIGLEGALIDREPLWWLILHGQHLMGLQYPWANVVSSGIFFGGVHVLARRQLDPLAFLILLFPILIVNMPMSGIRQGAAIGLTCVAFAAFIDRKPVSFAAWIVIAAGFHSSALILLLLTPLAGGQYSYTRLTGAALLAIPSALLLLAGDSGQMAVDRYVNTGVDAAGAAFRVGILSLSGLYFFLFLRRYWVDEFPEDYALASVGSIGMVVMMALVLVSTVIADRFGYYFIPIQTMIFARIAYLPLQSSRALHATLPYLGLILVFTVWSLLSGHFQGCYLPYNSWLFGFPGGVPFRI